jgi:hypothetical protein
MVPAPTLTETLIPVTQFMGKCQIIPTRIVSKFSSVKSNVTYLRHSGLIVPLDSRLSSPFLSLHNLIQNTSSSSSALRSFLRHFTRFNLQEVDELKNQ